MLRRYALAKSIRLMTLALLGVCVYAWLDAPNALLPRARAAEPPAAIPVTLPRDVLPSDVVSPQQRESLYLALEEHAQVLRAQSAVLKTVARIARPTVVHIEADVAMNNNRASGRRQQIEENGSGVIVKLDGKPYVLTNWHLIRQSTPETIRVNLADGRQIRPTRTWGNPDTDIAVMAMSDDSTLTAARLGNSDQTEVGDFVLAVGSPFGLTQSVTFGIISAKGRRDLQLGGAKVNLQDFLQTDAAINPGNSGGPLFNLRGEVIGINTAIASNTGIDEGIGFAIPINMFMHFGRQLVENGKITRAFLGVVLDSKFGQAAAAKVGLPRLIGTRITGITPRTPAAEAGLKVGDIILKFNDVAVEDDAHLIKLVGLSSADKRLPLVIFRDGETFVVEITVSDRAKYSANR